MTQCIASSGTGKAAGRYWFSGGRRTRPRDCTRAAAGQAAEGLRPGTGAGLRSAGGQAAPRLPASSSAPRRGAGGRGRGRNSQVAVQLHRRDAFQAGQMQIDGDGPFLQRDIRAFQHATCSDAEILLAIPAVVGMAAFPLENHVHTAAVRAIYARISPADIFEPFFRGSFVGKFLDQ